MPPGVLEDALRVTHEPSPANPSTFLGWRICTLCHLLAKDVKWAARRCWFGGFCVPEIPEPGEHLRIPPSAGSGAEGAGAGVTDVPGCELEVFLDWDSRGCAAAWLSSVPVLGTSESPGTRAVLRCELRCELSLEPCCQTLRSQCCPFPNHEIIFCFLPVCN